MFVLSCLASTFFFGGWQLPFISFETLTAILGSPLLASAVGVVVLLVKAAFFMWVFIWVRWTLPRFRYDQLMKMGWCFLMPLALANVVLTALVITLTKQ